MDLSSYKRRRTARQHFAQAFERAKLHPNKEIAKTDYDDLQFYLNEGRHPAEGSETWVLHYRIIWKNDYEGWNFCRETPDGRLPPFSSKHIDQSPEAYKRGHLLRAYRRAVYAQGAHARKYGYHGAGHKGPNTFSVIVKKWEALNGVVEPVWNPDAIRGMDEWELPADVGWRFSEFHARLAVLKPVGPEENVDDNSKDLV